jgi:hypothetical protein
MRDDVLWLHDLPCGDGSPATGARGLPKFYLAISFGGALGGVFVALVAPVIMND